MKKTIFQRIISGIRSQFLAGLVVILPLSVTIYVIISIFNWLDSLLGHLLLQYMPHSYITGLGLIILLVLIWLIGILTTNFFGMSIVGFYESVILKIPILNSLFGGLKDISRSLLSEKGTSFKQVVLVHNPVYDFYTMGFLSSTDLMKVRIKNKREELIHVLIPIPPNPTSGFVLLAPKKNLVLLDMPIEEGLKTVMSLGMIHPKNYGIKKKL
jgi:uncharacterized membrane protein